MKTREKEIYLTITDGVYSKHPTYTCLTGWVSTNTATTDKERDRERK